MRILAIADVEAKALWDHFDRRRLEGVDMILSCGDLDPQYLSFLATFTAAPVLYIHGNHDDCYAAAPPNNCICVENRIYTHQGVRVLGLGGSMRYKEEGNTNTASARCGCGSDGSPSSCTATRALTSC